jgi:hypothetical protein
MGPYQREKSAQRTLKTESSPKASGWRGSRLQKLPRPDGGLRPGVGLLSMLIIRV